MIGQIVGGLTQVAGSLIGGGKRRKELRDANAELAVNKARYENLDTSNLYTNMENTMEDLTVNQDAAKFQMEQQNQGLSNVMGQMSGAAGGSGIAALAQSLAGQQSQNARQASIDIGKQEQSNQFAAAQQAGNLQTMERQGAEKSRANELDKTETLLGMSQQRAAAAQQAKNQATDQLIGGIGSLASAAGGVVGGLPGVGDSPIVKALLGK